MIVLYILLAVLAFGIMIFFHELGHFTFAKIFKVAINEFSIGMGPKIFSKKGKDGVLYSLRAFPIGGYVAMAGEDEESDDPNSYDKKPAYQRFLIVIAGAVMNILVAVILVFVFTLSNLTYGTNKISAFDKDGVVQEYKGLMVNDEVIKIGNRKITSLEELSYEIMLNGSKPVDIIVIRNGEEITVEDVTFPTEEQDGFEYGLRTFDVYYKKQSFGSIIKNTFYTSVSAARMVWDSLIGLLTGKFGFQQLSGPIGVTGAMVEVAKVDIMGFVYLVAVISMNLGIFNLLPIPALDGGTLVITFIEMITKKRPPKKVEETIKLVGFGLLMALVLFVSIKDIFNLFVWGLIWNITILEERQRV